MAEKDEKEKKKCYELSLGVSLVLGSISLLKSLEHGRMHARLKDWKHSTMTLSREDSINSSCPKFKAECLCGDVLPVSAAMCNAIPLPGTIKHSASIAAEGTKHKIGATNYSVLLLGQNGGKSWLKACLACASLQNWLVCIFSKTIQDVCNDRAGKVHTSRCKWALRSQQRLLLWFRNGLLPPAK